MEIRRPPSETALARVAVLRAQKDYEAKIKRLAELELEQSKDRKTQRELDLERQLEEERRTWRTQAEEVAQCFARFSEREREQTKTIARLGTQVNEFDQRIKMLAALAGKVERSLRSVPEAGSAEGILCSVAHLASLPPTPVPEAKAHGDSADMSCITCAANYKAIAFSCGHMAYCQPCFGSALQGLSAAAAVQCPICRAGFTTAMRVMYQ
jgi:hypothetical protein